MRSKSILGLAAGIIVLLALPTPAAVVIACHDLGEGVAEFTYDTSDETALVRAFVFDITIGNGATIESIFDYKVGESTADDPGYGVFFDPESGIQIDDEGNIIDWGIPVASPNSPGALPGLGTYGITVEMGTFYFGTPNAPLSSDTLFKIAIDWHNASTANISIAPNIWRGDGDIVFMDDPDYNPTVELVGCTLVSEPIRPPVANADGPYTIKVCDTLTLDASSSTDADDDIVSYLWNLDDDDDNTFETDAGDQPVFDVNYVELQLLGLLINYEYTIHLKVTDSENQSDIAESTLTILPKPATVVAVDIKPGGCPNPVNTKSSGVLPVAILGTEDVNVLDIVPTSIRLAGVEPLRDSLEDVAAPVSDSNDCNCIKAGPDGFLDLTLKFETQAIVEAIGDVNDGDILTLPLTGVLYDPIPFETPIEGADCILIKGKYRTHNKADINKDGVVNMIDFTLMAENWLQSSIIED